jgi:hypothetical protein
LPKEKAKKRTVKKVEKAVRKAVNKASPANGGTGVEQAINSAKDIDIRERQLPREARQEG